MASPAPLTLLEGREIWVLSSSLSEPRVKFHQDTGSQNGSQDGIWELGCTKHDALREETAEFPESPGLRCAPRCERGLRRSCGRREMPPDALEQNCA